MAARVAQLLKRSLPPLIVLGVVIAGWYALAYSLDNNWCGGGTSRAEPSPEAKLLSSE